MITTRRHTNAAFDSDLRSLKDQITAMGHLVDGHVAEALRALLEKDTDLAGRVIDGDRAVDEMGLAIDEQCIRMLALYQAASDLRFIAAALKIVTDLERIGDLAVNMAERARALAEDPPAQASRELSGMAAAAREMLRDVLDAFVTGDVPEAEAVIEADAQMDAWTARLSSQVSAEMTRDPRAVARGIATIFFAKHIERMADHVTNVAEMVITLVRGQDVPSGRPN